MNLLQRIQEAIVDPSMKLADVLRLCKILAGHLRHQAFKEWVDCELNGYKDYDLPDYRLIKDVKSYGKLKDVDTTTTLKNAYFDTFPSIFKEMFETYRVRQNVNSLERIVSQAHEKEQIIFTEEWPIIEVCKLNRNPIPRFKDHYGAKSRFRKPFTKIWTEVPIDSLIEVLEVIKNRILDFVIEIEAEAPEVGDGKLSSQNSQELKTTYIFDRCILHQLNQSGSSSIGVDTFENHTNNMQGANVGNVANQVNDSAHQEAVQNIHITPEKQAVAEVAGKILGLLEEEEQANPGATEDDLVAYVNDETTPSFKRRAAGAFRAAGESAIDEFILESKYLKVAKAAIMGWIDPS
jgi:hypothetical protein